MLQILSHTLADPWFARQLAPMMFQQRHRVFKMSMNWAVQSLGDWEIDRYDTPGTRYILAWDAALGCLHGSWRLRPMDQPSLLVDVFPELLGGSTIDLSDRTWEISRFAVESSNEHGQQLLHPDELDVPDSGVDFFRERHERHVAGEVSQNGGRAAGPLLHVRLDLH